MNKELKNRMDMAGTVKNGVRDGRLGSLGLTGGSPREATANNQAPPPQTPPQQLGKRQVEQEVEMEGS